MNSSNIILIGMPGVGKSTVGVILAKQLGYMFTDSDLLIQQSEKKLLKDIIAEKGVDGFIEVEENILSDLGTDRYVVATGGSAVYGKRAMEHLKSIGTVVYLKLGYEVLCKRLGDLKGRGVVLREGQDLKALYEDRIPLYEKYADIVVEEHDSGIEDTLDRLLEELDCCFGMKNL